jgi:hypothetical protein
VEQPRTWQWDETSPQRSGEAKTVEGVRNTEGGP